VDARAYGKKLMAYMRLRETGVGEKKRKRTIYTILVRYGRVWDYTTYSPAADGGWTRHISSEEIVPTVVALPSTGEEVD
jgi:hypothetical protein